MLFLSCNTFCDAEFVVDYFFGKVLKLAPFAKLCRFGLFICSIFRLGLSDALFRMSRPRSRSFE